MLVFNNLEEMEPYLDKKTNTYRFNDDVQFCFDLCVDSSIDAENIDAWNIDAADINAGNINAENIDAADIDAADINAADINAGNIDAWNIDAWNIDAEDINALNIDALNINALDISYYAVCIAYQTFSCRSVRGKRENAIHACLDGEIEYKKMSARDEKGEAADV